MNTPSSRLQEEIQKQLDAGKISHFTRNDIHVSGFNKSWSEVPPAERMASGCPLEGALDHQFAKIAKMLPPP